MKASVRVARSEMPSRAAVAVAALCGVVIGALGGGILDAAVLGVLILIAFGVWRAVSYLSVIAAALTLPDGWDDQAAAEEVAETVRIR